MRCYLAAYHGKQKAGACECCGFADARGLVRKSMAGTMRTLCAICAVIAGRRAIDLEELKGEVLPPEGDRRRALTRRTGDRRSAADRRAVADLERLADLDAAERRATGRRATERAA